MNDNYYIASCVFTSKYPILSAKIQKYVRECFHIPVVRCCVPKYKLQFFADKMPVDYREEWGSMPDSGEFKPGNTVYSLCHNCSAIIEETQPEVRIRSLWELILSDDMFLYPDYGHQQMTIQDCWRAGDRRTEQDAVRQLLRRMNIDVIELDDNYEKTNFCGNSLYRSAPSRNLKLAPHRFVHNARGKFEVQTEEVQKQIMQEYCKRFTTKQVVGYCHYCVEGLELGGVSGKHIASLLFEPEQNRTIL